MSSMAMRPSWSSWCSREERRSCRVFHGLAVESSLCPYDIIEFGSRYDGKKACVVVGLQLLHLQFDAVGLSNGFPTRLLISGFHALQFSHLTEERPLFLVHLLIEREELGGFSRCEASLHRDELLKFSAEFARIKLGHSLCPRRTSHHQESDREQEMPFHLLHLFICKICVEIIVVAHDVVGDIVEVTAIGIT